MRRILGGTMRSLVVRVGFATAVTFATWATATSPAHADFDKDRACAQLRKLDDVTTLTTTQKKTLARTIETLDGSHSLGAAQVVRQLRTANRRGSNALAAAIRDASGWCVGRPNATTPAPTTSFPPQHLEDDEPGVFPLQIPNDAAAIAEIVVNGGGDLEVASLDAKGQRISTLVSTVAPYNGARPLNFEVGNDPLQLQVLHHGRWSIDVLPVGAAPQLSAPGTYLGSGDGVFAIVGSAKQARFEAPGADGSFRVDAYGTIRVNLVDGVTPYSGSVIMPSEANFVLVIETGSVWSVTLG
jgi:hypothetical protein